MGSIYVGGKKVCNWLHSSRTLIITYVQKQDSLVHKVEPNSGIWPLDPSSGNMTSLQVPWGVGGGKWANHAYPDHSEIAWEHVGACHISRRGHAGKVDIRWYLVPEIHVPSYQKRQVTSLKELELSLRYSDSLCPCMHAC